MRERSSGRRRKACAPVNAFSIPYSVAATSSPNVRAFFGISLDIPKVAAHIEHIWCNW